MSVVCLGLISSSRKSPSGLVEAQVRATSKCPGLTEIVQHARKEVDLAKCSSPATFLRAMGQDSFFDLRLLTDSAWMFSVSRPSEGASDLITAALGLRKPTLKHQNERLPFPLGKRVSAVMHSESY